MRSDVTVSPNERARADRIAHRRLLPLRLPANYMAAPQAASCLRPRFLIPDSRSRIPAQAGPSDPSGPRLPQGESALVPRDCSPSHAHPLPEPEGFGRRRRGAPAAGQRPPSCPLCLRMTRGREPRPRPSFSPGSRPNARGSHTTTTRAVAPPSRCRRQPERLQSVRLQCQRRPM